MLHIFLRSITTKFRDPVSSVTNVTPTSEVTMTTSLVSFFLWKLEST